ncbi:prolyl 4-hydroxylase [Chitinivorax tropicus]|uniref:Prolyl 4-hydroxylase n=1 Tax=Chitinivorax tropicus TaxID=714531 RepID=A0A840MVF1_9PROT|nr:2OG-Fe(II) oxygenase [Chitinivorax tropicus]MBB5019151.1 prolyl 4-hydroxylase [Chitinivorax tropicus]
MPQLDTAWQAWLNENINRGCSPESMIQAMMGAGFDQASASTVVLQLLQPKQVGPVVQAPVVIQQAPAVVEQPKAVAKGNYHYDTMPIAPGNRIDVGDREVKVLMRCERPQVVVFGDVLSHEECDEIIRRSTHKLKRSTTVNPLTGKEDIIERRTSEGTFFNRCEDDFIAKLDRRIARLMNWPMENGEGFQILRYGIGGEYRPHFDYFPPNESGSAPHLANGGQRVSTLVMYLNDVEAGGETIFPDAGMSVAPQKGSAAYFRYFNDRGQVDPMTLHGGAPVLAGEKWIMTKWMRQHRYG